jgi:hypothetical protein
MEVLSVRNRIVIGLFIGFAFLLSAASPAAAQLTFGVKGGLNVAKLSFDPDEGFTPENRMGLVVGMLVTQPLRSRFGLQVEALYSQKGAKDEFSEEGIDFKQTIQLDYIEIPVLANVAVTSTDTVRFSLNAGPTFGFLVNDKEVFEVDGEKDEDDIEDVKSYDIGFAVGGAVQTRQLIFDARYTWGLTNLNDDPDPEEASQKVKNKAFTFTVGWLFGR